jgi:uncharacterized membrane protein YkvA (DUF1232 family)
MTAHPLLTAGAIVAAGVVLGLLVAAWRLRRSAAAGGLPEAVLALTRDLVRLPGRLRRLAADPRTPRRARWWLIGIAIYVASPIDPIPDFLPVIGYLDEAILVPLALRHVRRMIPDEVWQTHFPPAATPDADAPAAA